MSTWTLAEAVEVRGDVHVHRASGDIPARIAIWRYQGSEPLPRFLERLKQDGDRWRTLRHPNLMPTLETGRLPSQITCYWVQEEVVGTSLAERLAIHPLVAPEHALNIARQVGTALQVVHRAQLVHGDLDPSNVILVDAKDKPRLAWGGLASRLEAAGMDVGRRSMSELAPEQLVGRTPTPSADTYALCALLFRMLSGQEPWTVRRSGPPPGVTADEPLPALPEWVSNDVRQILVEGLQRDPMRRPPLQELVDRIEDQEMAARGQAAPLGTWSAQVTSPPEATITPPTVNRTVDPMTRDDGDTLDSALANTPPSAHVLRMAPAPQITQATLAPSMAPLPARTVVSPARVQQRPSSLIVPAAVIGAALLIGFSLVAATVLWTGGRTNGANGVATVRPAPVQPAEHEGPELTPAGPAIFTLRTEPPNAEVWEAGTFVGLTPLEIMLDPKKSTDPRTFELKLAGYASQQVVQAFSKVDVQHTLTLAKAAPRPVQPAATTTAPAPGPAPAPVQQPRPAPSGRNLGIKVER
ncbi:MAG: protein kinase [Alphaproteobacteria bacterium]|nr:protein kinase [Alphaproteobacteria bacterium]